MKIVGVIPARYKSSRFPGKPLADICGKPMIWWVYERCKETRRVNEIIVATDDGRILDVCKKFGIPAMMTSSRHKNAASRLQEVSRTCNADFYVQINGDEPLVDIAAVEKCIPMEIPQDVEFGTNIITEMTEPSQVLDVSNIKVVFDANMNALYMSRSPIPTPFGTLDFKYYKHVGIIGYNKKMLDFYAQSTPGIFEKIEGIDTLRFLDYGKALRLVLVENLKTLSVDTPKDLDICRRLIETQEDNFIRIDGGGYKYWTIFLPLCASSKEAA